MKIKDELQVIYEEQADVSYCCYCLEPQGDKLTCCFDNDFAEFKHLLPSDQQKISQEILNGQ
jgi:hypothetical protein